MQGRLPLGAAAPGLAVAACAGERDMQTSSRARQNLNCSLADCNRLSAAHWVRLTTPISCDGVFGAMKPAPGPLFAAGGAAGYACRPGY
jgi:hypothetical protein